MPPPLGEVPLRGGEGLGSQKHFDIIRLELAVFTINDIDAPLTANISHNVVSVAETRALPLDRLQDERVVAAPAPQIFAKIRHK